MTPQFKPFPKLPRLSRECIITEKIDGTNASILIASSEGRPISCAIHEWWEEGQEYSFVMLAGSRTRWITPQDDNFGFARWVQDHAAELVKLGPGHHFGEWWGQGIQRHYGLKERRFSLFNTPRWALHGTEPQSFPTADPRLVKRQDVLPACVGLVPVLYQGEFDTNRINETLTDLEKNGSEAAPGFMKPEGIVAFHVAGNVGFKKTIEKDHQPKGS
jgi:hypothetical protein